MKIMLFAVFVIFTSVVDGQTIYTPSQTGSPGFTQVTSPVFSGTSTVAVENVTTSLIVGSATNTPSFTLVNTNFVSGQLYTNLTGRPIMVSANATLTTTGVSGNAALDLRITGNVTNHVGISTLVTSIAQSYTNSISGFVPAGSTYVFTNVSSGAGDAAGVNGGQYLVY